MTDETAYPSIRCLDHGHVTLVDHMGNDKRIVDAARVSYQRGTTKVSSDRHLIRYLIRNHHTTPLEKVRFEFHVKLPIFIARQWMRHRMGSFNEVSARYSVMPEEFYIPSEFRKQSSTNRQGSSNETIRSLRAHDTYDGYELSQDQVVRSLCKTVYKEYEAMIEGEVAREQARMILPVSLYTEFYWTVDLWNLMHFLKLRLDSHAQYEIRVYGEAILQLIKEHCDLEYAIEAFEDYILDAPNLTKYEVEIIKDMIVYASNVVSGPAVTYDELKEHLKWLIDEQENMSKREKAESKLMELLFGEKNVN